MIGVCGGPFLRPDSGFIGLYAVRKQYFGRKIGQKLFKSIMTYIGERNCGLFAIPDKIELYRDHLGFKVESNRQMVIYFGKGVRNCVENSKSDVRLEPIVSDDLIEDIIRYDQQIHGYRRDRLLNMSLREPESLYLSAIDSTTGSVVGYGSIRENCSKFATLSPIYTNSRGIAEQLVINLVNVFEIAVKNYGLFYVFYQMYKDLYFMYKIEDLFSYCDHFFKEYSKQFYYNRIIISIKYSKIYFSFDFIDSHNFYQSIVKFIFLSFGKFH